MKLKDETGLALPLILVVVFVLTVLGTTLYMLSTTETRQVLHDENKMKAHYLARSGAHAVASKIINNPDIADALVNAGASEPYYYGDGHYRVEVAYMDVANPEESKIVVKSTGVVNNISQSIDVTIEKVDIDAAVYAKDFHICGSGGKGITNTGDGDADVVYGGGDLDDMDPDTRSHLEDLIKHGELREGPFNFAPVVLPCADPELVEVFDSCPGLPGGVYNGGTIRDSKYFEHINIRNRDDLNIHPEPGENILIKADKIDIASGTGKDPSTIVTLEGGSIVAIVIDGEFNNRRNILVRAGEEGDDPEGGHLLIYVKDYPFNGGGNVEIGVQGNAAINFYILKDGTLDLRGTQNFEGSIYGPEAESIQRGNATIIGWIIANKVEGRGGLAVQFKRISTINTSMSLDFYSEERWRYLD